MRYAQFAKICEKCGKVPNMRQSHIRVFLTRLTSISISIITAVYIIIIIYEPDLDIL